MIVGVCGVCCSVCRLYVTSVCTGCAQGNECPAEKVVEFACPILSCATSRNVPFCVRDCSEYPCAFYQGRLSICERSVVGDLHASPDQKASALSRTGVRINGHEGELQLKNNREAQLNIFCLGPLRVFRDGKCITAAEWGQTKGPAQKVKALFAYLLAKGACGATKDAIIELLWSDQLVNDKVDARLHAAIYYLRRALEPTLSPPAESRYIIYENGCYKLSSPDGLWIDAVAFKDYYQHAQRLEEEGQEDIAARFWKLAEALYQGDYMIDLAPCYTEDYIDDCCKWQRYRLKDMHLTVLLKLAHYHFRCSNNQLSLTYAQKVLDQDRGCEEAYCLVMNLMCRTGQRHDLVRQFRLCERNLKEAEDRSPSQGTVQLYQQLLQTLPER